MGIRTVMTHDWTFSSIVSMGSRPPESFALLCAFICRIDEIFRLGPDDPTAVVTSIVWSSSPMRVCRRYPKMLLISWARSELINDMNVDGLFNSIYKLLFTVMAHFCVQPLHQEQFPQIKFSLQDKSLLMLNWAGKGSDDWRQWAPGGCARTNCYHTCAAAKLGEFPLRLM